MSESTPPAVPEPTPPASGYTAQPAAANPYSAAATGPVEPKVLSIISMVAGILGVISFGWFGIASIAALILGYMGKKREPAAKGFWLTGIITGWVGIGLMILVVGGFILITVFAMATSNSYY